MDYTDIEHFELTDDLKKSCDVRGFSIAIEMIYSYDAENKPVSCAENIVVRRKDDNSIVFMAVSFIHAHGFLDGLDYAKLLSEKK